MIPGSNLLNRAARLIRLQPVNYYQDIGRYTNAIGLDETQFTGPIEILGSVQAVPLNVYEQLGLDFGRNYVTLYTTAPLIGVQRDVTGDIFTFSGKTYQCRSTTNWIGMDGWNAVLAVEVSIAAPVVDDFVITPEGLYVVTPDGDFVVTP